MIDCWRSKSWMRREPSPWLHGDYILIWETDSKLLALRQNWNSGLLNQVALSILPCWIRDKRQGWKITNSCGKTLSDMTKEAVRAKVVAFFHHESSTLLWFSRDPFPGLGRSPGGGHGKPLQYSCLQNLHGQRSLADCGVAKSCTRLSTRHTQLRGNERGSLCEIVKSLWVAMR